MTKQARLENSLLLILKRGSWTTWCRKVKICWRLSGEGNRWEWRRRGRLTRPGGPDKIVQELICRKGGESVVHHPCNQIPQLVSDCWFDFNHLRREGTRTLQRKDEDLPIDLVEARDVHHR